MRHTHSHMISRARPSSLARASNYRQFDVVVLLARISTLYIQITCVTFNYRTVQSAIVCPVYIYIWSIFSRASTAKATSRNRTTYYPIYCRQIVLFIYCRWVERAVAAHPQHKTMSSNIQSGLVIVSMYVCVWCWWLSCGVSLPNVHLNSILYYGAGIVET